ncbi:MAG: DUF6599 family protein [Nitrospirota bacterium]
MIKQSRLHDASVRAFFILTIMLTSSMVDTTENPMLKFLPDEIYGWKAQKKVENYNRETIYDYIDGAGEIYLAYNLVQYQNIGYRRGKDSL